MTTPMTPAKRKLPRSALTIGISAALLGILYGYDNANVSVAQLYYQPDLGLSTAQNEAIVTAVPYGILIGCLLGGFFANRFGRKPTTMAIVVGYFFFCLAQAASWNFEALFTARVLLGFTIGVSLVAVPVFIAESVATKARGSVLVGYQVAEVGGIIVAYVIGLLLLGVTMELNWRIMFALAAAPPLVLFPLVLKVPETSRWLMLKGRRAEAAEVMRRIDPDADVDAVLDEVQQGIDAETGGSLGDMFRRPFLRASVFLIVLGFLIQITGINATIAYGPALMRNMGIGAGGVAGGSASDNGPAITFALVVQVLAFIAVIVAMKYVDRWGRRPILIGGFAAMLVGLVLAAVVYETAGEGSWQTWQKVVGIVAFAVINMAFAFGIGGTVWAFASESLPTKLRSYGATFLLTADLVGNIIVVQFFQSAMDSFGGAIVFGFFAVCSVVAILFVAKFAPETKGRDVDDVRLFWENGGKWPKNIDKAPA